MMRRNRSSSECWRLRKRPSGQMTSKYHQVSIAYERGDDAEAEQIYKRALAIKEKVLGPDHPDVAMTLNNLVVLYKSQGKYTEAEPLYRRTLSIFEKALGPTHPNVTICLENYAQLLREMNREAEALDLEFRAL